MKTHPSTSGNLKDLLTEITEILRQDPDAVYDISVIDKGYYYDFYCPEFAITYRPKEIK